MTPLQLLQLLLANLGKAPIVLAFVQSLVALFTKLFTDLGQPVPPAIPHAEGSEEAKLIDQLAAALQADGAAQARKFGDGTLLKTLFGALAGLMANPIFGPILQLLLGKLGGLFGGTPTPAPTA